jgi:hypothetical protein
MVDQVQKEAPLPSAIRTAPFPSEGSAWAIGVWTKLTGTFVLSYGMKVRGTSSSARRHITSSELGPMTCFCRDKYRWNGAQGRRVGRADSPIIGPDFYSCALS